MIDILGHLGAAKQINTSPIHHLYITRVIMATLLEIYTSSNIDD